MTSNEMFSLVNNTTVSDSIKKSSLELLYKNEVNNSSKFINLNNEIKSILQLSYYLENKCISRDIVDRAFSYKNISPQIKCQVYAELGDIENYLKYFKQTDIATSKEIIYIHRLIKEGAFKEAVEVLKMYIYKDGYELSKLLTSLELLFIYGGFDILFSFIDLALDHMPGNYEILYRKATYLYKLTDFKGAMNILNNLPTRNESLKLLLEINCLQGNKDFYKNNKNSLSHSTPIDSYTEYLFFDFKNALSNYKDKYNKNISNKTFILEYLIILILTGNTDEAELVRNTLEKEQSNLPDLLSFLNNFIIYGSIENIGSFIEREGNEAHIHLSNLQLLANYKSLPDNSKNIPNIHNLYRKKYKSSDYLLILDLYDSLFDEINLEKAKTIIFTKKNYIKRTAKFKFLRLYYYYLIKDEYRMDELIREHDKEKIHYIPILILRLIIEKGISIFPKDISEQINTSEFNKNLLRKLSSTINNDDIKSILKKSFLYSFSWTLKTGFYVEK